MNEPNERKRKLLEKLTSPPDGFHDFVERFILGEDPTDDDLEMLSSVDEAREEFQELIVEEFEGDDDGSSS